MSGMLNANATHLEQDMMQLLQELIVQHFRLLRGQRRIPELRKDASVSLFFNSLAFRPSPLASRPNPPPNLPPKVLRRIQDSRLTHLARGADECGPFDAREEAAEEVCVELGVAQLDRDVLELQREVV